MVGVLACWVSLPTALFAVFSPTSALFSTLVSVSPRLFSATGVSPAAAAAVL